ncbi:MAG: bifunctional diaminohydroxyphosphoribosylaminopyrimidine deaminase/5-amino-6-(5-phosphoribosylamino)uracil reductase RibD [Planctomycetota bacterium]
MNRALNLAHRGQGLVEPNPMVGCVLVRKGRIIGEGFHRRFGGPHAEVEALRSCEVNPRGAIAYVTLEPCCHQGKTPPCTDALIRAGVARVVVGVRDPNPLVGGRGLQALRRAGVQVDVGICQSEARALIAPFTTWMTQRRPYVIAKWAQGIDGSLVTPPDVSRWISCEASRRFAHQIRARVDAIVVGVGTVLADNPTLTARGVRVRRVATRIVLDPRLRTPLNARVTRDTSSFPTLVVATPSAACGPKADRFRRKGVEVIGCRSRDDGLDLSDCLSTLAARGMTNVLVEGGPTILTAFFSERLVDEAFVFVAPRWIGGHDARRTPRSAANVRPSADFFGRVRAPMAAVEVITRRVGSDVLYHLLLSKLLRDGR